MIQLSNNYSLPERADEIIPIKIVGVGGAGSNALDRIVLDGLEGAEVIADQHRRAIARQLRRRAQSAARPDRYARAWAQVAIPKLAIRPRSNRQMKFARR